MDIRLVGDSELVADFKERPVALSLAMIRAMNRGIGAANTLMASGIARDTGLKNRDVKSAMNVHNATLFAPTARLSSSLHRLPLSKWPFSGPQPSRGRGRGVTVRIKGGAGRYPNAFIVKLRSGHVGIFERAASGTTKKSKGAWSNNLPIVELPGPSIGHVFLKFRDAGIRRAMEVFDSTLTHELERRTPATVTVSESGGNA